VREGKASDGTLRSPRDIAQPKTIEERAQAAVDCIRGMKLTVPVLVDGMDGAVRKAYMGYPAGTAVIDTTGTIRFNSRGPHGAQPKEAEKLLQQILADLKASGKLPPPAEKPAEASATK